MSNCMLMKANGKCDGLKETRCENCKFHITKEEYERKEAKARDWYRKYGQR